jgi:hypothetical protein
VADDLGEHAKRSKHAGERSAFADLEEVGVHQRVPDGVRVGVDDGRDFVGDVIDGEEVLGEHRRDGSAGPP